MMIDLRPLMELHLSTDKMDYHFVFVLYDVVDDFGATTIFDCDFIL